MRVGLRNTIERDLGVHLGVVILLVGAIAGATNYYFALQQAEGSVERRIDIDSDRLAQTLGLHLWNFDELAIELVCDTALKSRELSGVRVFDEQDKLAFEGGDFNGPHLHKSRRTVRFKDRTVGRFEAAHSTALIAQSKKGILKATMLVVLAIAVSYLPLMLLQLRRYVVGPLRDLQANIVRVSEGNYDASLPIRGKAEIQSIMNAFSELSRKLATREVLIEKRTTEIQKKNSDLGREVAVRHEAELAAKKAEEALRLTNLQLERAIERANEMAGAAEDASVAKSEFLANMSHEIRTPMTAILGFAENMLDAGQSDAERLNCIHIIRHNGEHLLGLINDILDLSKIEADKMTVERTDCHPCRIVADVTSLMGAQAEAKGIRLNIEYVGAIPETVQSDPTRLRQILINLVGNAIKFTEVGSVRLVTRLIDDSETPRLRFDIVDTGQGLTDGQVENLFQPFVQADSSTTRDFGGTGLGLTISKRFAALLGGDITVAEAEVGVGSTFRVTVATGSLDGMAMLANPLAATVVPAEPVTAAQFSPFGMQGRRILVAEDNPTNQVLVVGILRKTGADVRAVKDGQLALDAALAARDGGKPFDVILMDMQMPIMDGYKAASQLRKVGYAGTIIALTANAMDGDSETCLRAGCDDYATKPINRTKLLETIQRHLIPTDPGFIAEISSEPVAASRRPSLG